jgi:hypothetical protein
MTDRDRAAPRNPSKDFRKEAQARDGAAAWKEYVDREATLRRKTEKLRAQRLARDASGEIAAVPAAQPAASAGVPKSGVPKSAATGVKKRSATGVRKRGAK